MPNLIEVRYAVDDDGSGRRVIKEIDAGIDKTGETAARVNEIIKRTFGQSALAGPFNVPSRSPFAAPTIASAQFIRQANDVDKVTAAYGRATKAAGQLHGATQIGQAILSQFGVHGSQALESIANQALLAQERGQGLAAILSSPILGFSLAIAGAVAFGTVLGKIFGQLVGISEESLKAQKRIFSLKEVGLSGGASQIETDLESLEKAKKEFSELLRIGQAGRANEVLKNVLGEGANITILESRIEQTKRVFGQLQSFRFQAGDKENIFDKANDSLLALAESAGRTSDLKAFLASMRERAAAGALGSAEFSGEVEKFRRSLEGAASVQKQAASAGGQDTFLRIDAINRQLEGLRQQADNNPVAKIFNDAADALASFRKEAPEAGDAAAKLIQQIRDQQLFALALGQGKDRFSTREQIRLLQEGFGGEDIREQSNKADKLRADLEAQIRAARQTGDQSTVRQLQQQFAEIGAVSRRDTFAIEARRREIEFAQQFLEKAATPEDRRQALQFVVDATRDIGQLTEDQLAIRLKALNEQLQLGQFKRPEVLITIENKALGVADTQVSDGARPGPELN